MAWSSRPASPGLLVHARALAALALLAAGTAVAADAVPEQAQSAAAAPVACSAGTTISREYVFSLMGNHAGFQTLCLHADGAREVHFAFNDRGRGPTLTSLTRLDAGGVPIAISTDGQDYYKAAVAERFSIVANDATWKNKVESGSRMLDKPAFYVSQSGSPDETGLLANALRRAPQGRLALLPLGEARLAELAQVNVSKGGESRHVTLYSIDGLGFQPVNVWLDPDGELFATFDGFSSLVLAGWEATLPTLRTEQDRQDARRRVEQARSLQRVPEGPIAIEHANLFDAETASMRPGTTVLIAGKSIVAVGPDGTVEIPAGAERIDATGRSLLPGLWDMHTHPELDDGPLYLAAGVTSIRDMAAEPDKPQRLRVFDTGDAIGPRVVYAGIIDGRGPFQAPTRVLASNEAEVRTAVQAMAAAGFGMVKIYSSLDPALVPVVVDEARRHGMRVGGHIPAYMTAEQAVRAGYNEIQHMNMLFLNFMFDSVQDTRTPARFTAVADHAAEIDPQSERVQAFLKLLRQKNVTIDPTLGVFEGLYTDRPGEVSPVFAAVADRMPPQVRRGFLEGGLPVPEGADARYRETFRSMQRMLMALRQAGIPFVAGTDSMAGFALPRELELYVEAGVPPLEVLRITTLDAARHVGRGNELGSIAPGKLADMILVDGDPSRNIGDVRRLRLVVKDGTVIDPDALGRALGIQPLQAERK
jgi:imidazolonepropionase-like amidohydrolase